MSARSTASSAIVLTTLNAKYIHASLGLRYLLANMGDLREYATLREFTIVRSADEIVAELLATLDAMRGRAFDATALQIVGFGVYVWNVVQTTDVVRRLRVARPDVRIVLGGPEVSHETDEQEIVTLADHVITGWGEASFPRLCRALIDGRQTTRCIAGEQMALADIVLPYREYSDADLAHRLLYVEASRGCPFRCEFCLSALDKTAWSFDLDRFLDEMQRLYERGARNFKFVDRTFNLKVDASERILQFFLDHLASGSDSAADRLFVHFEMIPDHLPERLRRLIAQFPAGTLQLEVGIQSFNEAVQQRISRRQDNAKAAENLRWLLNHTQAHVHADLVFGLPGETLDSFACGFDRLYRMAPHEIQLGLLKRLRGAPIDRHTVEYAMRYDRLPPYAVQQTGVVDAGAVQRFARLARYWDMLANSGRFRQSLRLLMGGGGHGEASSPFASFLALADWLWERAQRTNGLSPEWLVDALFDYLVACGLEAAQVRDALLVDYTASGARGKPLALSDRVSAEHKN
ncbi:MAG: DUF4080 domain-containing protein [Propionivibrio sp.]